MVDWVILLDMSFLNATSSATRGLLTWNRTDMLRALPSSATTLSEYVHKMMDERKEAVHKLIASTASKVSISIDVWTSSNYLSFLGVVAHFAGKDFQESTRLSTSFFGLRSTPGWFRTLIDRLSVHL